MLKQEFEELVGHEVTQAEYDMIEDFYLEVPQDKHKFAELWKQEGDGVLLLEAVRCISECKNLYSEKCKEYTELEGLYNELKHSYNELFAYKIKLEDKNTELNNMYNKLIFNIKNIINFKLYQL